MSVLVERLIAYRDDLRLGRGTMTRPAMDLLAEAANALVATEAALRAALADVRHWQADVDAGCLPIPEGFARSETALLDAIAALARSSPPAPDPGQAMSTTKGAPQ